MTKDWVALECDKCGGKLQLAGMPFAFTVTCPHELTEHEVARIHYMFEQMAEHPRPEVPLVVSGGIEIARYDDPLGGLLRCESCGMLYERRSEK